MKQNPNAVMQGSSGAIGDVVFRETPEGRRVVCLGPRPRQEIPTAQEAVIGKFKEAAFYAKYQTSIPETKAEYDAGRTSKKRSAYAVAMTDFLNPPKVDMIDATFYRGNVGDKIVIKALD